MKLAVIKNKGAAVITSKGYVLLSTLGFMGSLEQLILAGNSVLTEIKNKLAQSKEFISYKDEELDAPLRKPGKDCSNRT